MRHNRSTANPFFPDTGHQTPLASWRPHDFPVRLPPTRPTSCNHPFGIGCPFRSTPQTFRCRLRATGPTDLHRPDLPTRRMNIRPGDPQVAMAGPRLDRRQSPASQWNTGITDRRRGNRKTNAPRHRRTTPPHPKWHTQRVRGKFIDVVGDGSGRPGRAAGPAYRVTLRLKNLVAESN